jgi:hypothetical protein
LTVIPQRNISPPLRGIFARSVLQCYGFTTRLGESSVLGFPQAALSNLIHRITGLSTSILLHQPLTHRSLTSLTRWCAVFIVSDFFTTNINSLIRQVCIKLNSKPAYVRLPEGNKVTYEDYGPETLESWHKKNNLYKA